VIKGKKRHFEVGVGDNKFSVNAIRKRPNMQRFSNFMDEMGNDFADHDVYLWGSWPEKKSTWDVDVLLKTPDRNLNFEQMEHISKKALESSLINNNFLADVGYTEKEVMPFQQYVNKFNKTGNKTSHNGYVFGQEWYVDGKQFKDRMKFSNGVVIPRSNNILKINSTMPYPKMISSIENNTFDSYYGNKPIKIKDRKKIYGNY